MSSESSVGIARFSRRTLGTSVLSAQASLQKLSKFGLVVCALWPTKPGLRLAQLVGCTERHANLIIAGKRKPNARTAHALLGEILSD
jgi:hypothetical protein